MLKTKLFKVLTIRADLLGEMDAIVDQVNAFIAPIPIGDVLDIRYEVSEFGAARALYDQFLFTATVFYLE